MHPIQEQELNLTRRHFFGRSAAGIGAAALASLLEADGLSAAAPSPSLADPLATHGGALPKLHHKPTAKRVISLFMAGGPSQIDLFDYKPKMAEMFNKDLPASIRMGKRISTMTSGQKRLPIAPSKYKFLKQGQSGTYLSELLPHTAKIIDEITIVKSMHTEAINHDPAITFIQTGAQIPGRPSFGSWISYGLGSPNKDLPAFVVMTPTWTSRPDAQALYSRLWGTGFLPSQYQGVGLRSKGDAVLYLSNPGGIDPKTRRKMLDGLAELNAQHQQMVGDPEIGARIAQYEMAYRMQTSVPELVDFSKESKATLALYGPEVTKPGTFAASCLLARRMAERGVPFTQIYIRGWDHHHQLPKFLEAGCRDIDQPAQGLIMDLKQRGMLEDTLVTFGGEFGRTAYCQGKLTKENYGRDHHPQCFSMWMAGGGIKKGFSYGETDDFSYNITTPDQKVHVHDLNATIMHALGINHKKLTYRFQGRNFRLTDVAGEVKHDLLA